MQSAASSEMTKFVCGTSTSRQFCCGFLLLLLAITAGTIGTATADAKFLLSCRVISGICQGDGRCLDEMSARFPDCYLESPFDLMPAKGQELLLASHIPADSEEQQRPAMLEKRALKLMKVLMMKDRIPVGRR